MSVWTNPANAYTPERLNGILQGSLSAINAESVFTFASGFTAWGQASALGGESILSLEVRGTFVATLEVSGSVNGVDFTTLFPRNAILQITAPWVFRYNCAGYTVVRVRVVAYTSGTALTTLSSSLGMMSDRWVTAVSPGLGGANVAQTLTIPAIVGMRHYISRIEIWRVNGTATAVTPSALLGLTTTNLPANYGWTVSNGIIAWGQEKLVDASFDAPLVPLTANTATTIVLPAGGAGVQWRSKVHYFLGE